MPERRRKSHALRTISRRPELRAQLARLSQEFQRVTSVSRPTIREDFAQIVYALEVIAAQGNHDGLEELLAGARPFLRRDVENRGAISAESARIRWGSRGDALVSLKDFAVGLRDDILQMLDEGTSLAAIADECASRSAGLIEDVPSAAWSQSRCREEIRLAILRLKKKATDPNAIVRAALRALQVPKQDVDNIFKFEAQQSRRNRMNDGPGPRSAKANKK